MVVENPELDPTVPAWAIRTFIQGLANAILSLPEEEQRRFLGDLETQTQTNRGRRFLLICGLLCNPFSEGSFKSWRKLWLIRDAGGG